MGVPLLPRRPQWLSRRQACITTGRPFLDPNGVEHDADFCFGYGADDGSFDALNYRNPYRRSNRPAHFLHRFQPLLLGNFAVGIGAPASGMLIEPPPDLEVAGIAEVATARRSSVFMWLGVRYNVGETASWVVDDLTGIELTEPVMSGPPLTYAYGSVFSKQFAGARYALSPEEEYSLRRQMGYPTKGKPIREQMLYDAVCSIFSAPAVVRRYRGKELEGLELDVWVPAHRLGFEYQGEQHFQAVAHWRGEAGLAKQRERDTRKRGICKRLEITLVEFGPNDSLSKAAVLTRLRAMRVL